MPLTLRENRRLLLKRLHFKGFKSIEDLKVDLSDGLNILIGMNGAGKSNFLECIYYAFRHNLLRSEALIPYRFAKVDMISEDKHLLSIELERVIQKNLEREERHPLEVSIKETLSIDDEVVYSNFDINNDSNVIEFNGKNILKRGNAGSIISKLGYRMIWPLYLRFSMPTLLDCIDIPGTLKIPLLTTDIWETPTSTNFINNLFIDLEFSHLDGRTLKLNDLSKKTLLKYIKINDEVVSDLRKFTPIQDIRFNENINIYKDEKTVTVENLKLDFKVNSTWLPWSQLSDGTKRLFYLVSEISDTGSKLILIEEPELGVHPKQFNLIMNFLREQSEDKQILISTHSPKALDHLNETELGNILVAKYSTKAGTQIKHLTPIQKKKAIIYMKEVGFLSDYWIMSNLE